MRKPIFAATAAIAVMAAMPAAAAEWYAQVNAGGTVESKAELTATFVPNEEEAGLHALAIGVDGGGGDEGGGGDTEIDFDEEGTASMDGDLENGVAVGAAAGVMLGGGVRLEGEALFSSNDLGGLEELGIENVELNHMAFFANVIYDIPMGGGFNPYIGAGVGYGSITFDVDGESIHDEDTAWQVKAGLSWSVNDTLTLDVGYRYLDMATWEVGAEDEDGALNVEVEPTAHALMVGARFRLGAGAS